MLAPGQLIDRFELVAPIGEGGMAHVWAARTPEARIVALKIIHSRLVEDANFRAMFLDEARIVAPIQHPNIAQVFELGEKGTLLYLVMEYVDGESVFTLTAPQRVVPVPIALRIAADACAGLHAVHARAVVHRDVSPQNVLVATNGEVKLIDFGIARARDRAAKATEPGSVRGKVRYMAPEQARQETLGPHTDVFGVGATLFRMLSGRAPYAAANDIETLQALIGDDPPMHRLPEDVPPQVARAVLRAIAPRPSDRFATVRELGLALESIVTNLPERPDVAGWVVTNLSAEGRALRDKLVAATKTPELDAPKGFMDIGALAARAKAGGDLPPDVPIELAAEPRTMGAIPELPGRRRALKYAIFAVAGALLFVAFLLFLPRIVRDRTVVAAREMGFEITIGGVGVDFSGITLRDIDVKTAVSPGITATIREAHVTFSETNLIGVDTHLRGSRDEILGAIDTLATNARTRFAGSTKSAQHLTVAAARVTWDGIEGKDSQLVAGDIGVDFTSRGPSSEDVRAAVGAFDLKLPQTKLGPWSSSLERTPASTRLRVMFDPAVPDGPSALFVWGKNVPSEVTVKIPRSPFKHLGVVPADLGIPADDITELELLVQGRYPAGARSETTTDLTLHRARFKTVNGALDVHAEGKATGLAGKPLDLERASVTFGPFIAGVTGTVTPHDRGLRIDAMFKTLPLTCEKFVKNEAKNMGPLVAALQEFGQTTGAYRVTGAVNVSGIVSFDTASADDARVQWLARETCGLSIFGK